jgi:hypothetical protein
MDHDTRHPSGDTLIRAIDGELPAALAGTLDAHLAACPACAADLAALRSVSDAAAAGQRAAGQLPAPELARLRARLKGALAAESTVLERSWRFQIARRFNRIPAAALAAVAALVIAAGATILRDEMENRRITAAAEIEEAALPIPALTPGATAPVTVVELCGGRGPSPEAIAPSIRQAVLRDYGLERLSDAEYELDYLITPELGGSSDRRNLWPERYGSRVWNARVKDELERLLPALVCGGSVELTTAQREIAADWIAAYKKYFHPDRPVVAQARLETPD